jgi:hypothetical protein
MKSLLWKVLFVVIIGWSIVVTVAQSPSYKTALWLDYGQLALDNWMPVNSLYVNREYKAAHAPLVRKAEVVKKQGSNLLLLVEFQIGAENDRPHIAYVTYNELNKSTTVDLIQ